MWHKSKPELILPPRRVSLVKRARALPPVGSRVEFIPADSPTGEWRQGVVRSVSATGNVWITDAWTHDHPLLALPTEVRPYR